MRVAFALVLLLAGTAGCLREHEEYEEPSYLRLAGLDLAPERVLAQDVVLNVTPIVENLGRGDTGEVLVRAKAYSEDTGFRLSENETTAGVIGGESTRIVSQFLRVPRQGSIRVDVSLVEGERVQKVGSISARNLGSLEPEVLDTGLRISDIDFLVQGVGGDSNASRATIRSDLYITNEGDAPSENLRLQVKAREISTSLVSDIQWSETGVVEPGTTVIRSVNLTVPQRYNYVFEIITWRGDVVVARSEGTVQLAPTFEKPKDQELVVTNPNLNDFRSPTTASPTYESDRGGGFAGSGATPTPQVPGFGLAAALLAVAAVALVLSRRRS